jgi:hypothetical protein
MRSVTDQLRADDRQALARLTPAERVTLALALGARDLESFRTARRPPLAPAEAAQALERMRQAARQRSRCIEELIG